MKKIALTLITALTIGVVFNSCTMEKRQYSSGYHTDWNNSGKNTAVKTQKNSSPIQPSKTSKSSTESSLISILPTTQVSNNNGIIAVAPQKKVALKASKLQAISNFSGTETNKVIKKTSVIKQGNNVTKKSSPISDKPDTILLVIIAFLIPPLAVYLYEGKWTKRCTINLILTLLCGLPGLIHALIVVLD
jgi:uncharacterized membrane protein YqaE (UPF0057 family)